MIGTLLLLVIVAGAVVLIPLLALRIAFGLAWTILLLPFKLLGVAVKLLLGLFGLVFKLVFGAFGLVLGLLAVVVALVFAPLLPLLLLLGGLWLLARLIRGPRPQAASPRLIPASITKL